ncbi:MAG TPA: glycosyltransferase family 4 protein [Candidatus Saccharimonadia bacterium]|jgi:phosphatidylinositol alpha-mannosyltransferase
MKIGIICPYNVFMPGGVQTLVADQSTELRRRGHQVVVITPRPQGYSGEPPQGTVFIGQSARIRAQHTWVDVSASVDTDVIDRVLATEKFDLVHAHEPLIPFLAWQVLGRLYCPVIGTFHASLPDSVFAKSIAGSIGPYKRSIFRRLNIVTAVSGAATSYLDGEIEPERIHIVPNGINVESFRLKKPPARDPHTILFVGRLEKRKGVRYLLDAFALLQPELPHARLLIAGDGPERNRLEGMVRQRKLSGVKFLGSVSDKEKVELLSRCGLFTSPAPYGESFGIVLLEAMAAGAVVVAGANSGYESVLTGTGRLSLVDPRRGAEYARRLSLLLTDDQLQSVWRTWADRHVHQFNFTSVVDQYERLYEQLVPALK